MPTPRLGYFAKDGEKVPSVTTILSRFKESGGLVHWAWKLGTEGKDYRKERDSAANVGTIVHDLIEKFFRGDPLPRDVKGLRKAYPELSEEEAKRAGLGFKAAKKWAEQTKLQVTDMEMQLVSEKYRFGGTPDAILVNGKRAMGDWKTSNRCYPEYRCQLAAYGMLWNENNPDDPIEDGFYLLRFDKNYGDFHMHYWADLSEEWEYFKLLRQAYDLANKIKERE